MREEIRQELEAQDFLESKLRDSSGPAKEVLQRLLDDRKISGGTAAVAAESSLPATNRRLFVKRPDEEEQDAAGGPKDFSPSGMEGLAAESSGDSVLDVLLGIGPSSGGRGLSVFHLDDEELGIVDSVQSTSRAKDAIGAKMISRSALEDWSRAVIPSDL